MHPKRAGDGDAFVGVFLIYGFEVPHEPQQRQAAFLIAVDDVNEGWVFAEEETEVVTVVVQRLAEVAYGKVNVGFDEFFGEAGHWGDRIVTEITKSCRCRSRRSSGGLTERSGQYLLGVVPIKLLSARISNCALSGLLSPLHLRLHLHLSTFASNAFRLI